MDKELIIDTNLTSILESALYLGAVIFYLVWALHALMCFNSIS